MTPAEFDLLLQRIGCLLLILCGASPFLAWWFIARHPNDTEEKPTKDDRP